MGCLEGVFGLLGGVLGPLLEASWGVLEASWKRIRGASLCLGPSWGDPGGVLGRLGSALAASWDVQSSSRGK